MGDRKSLKLMPDEKAFRNLHDQVHKLANRFGEPGPEMETVSDFTIEMDSHHIPMRLYVPANLPAIEAAKGPCFVYLHGGGFVVGSIETHDGLCRRIALSSAMRVLSVDYRLAPRHPFPAGPDDCEQALLYALSDGGARGIDANKITIGGDSAGGNMASYLAQKYRQKICAQALLYPLMQLAEKEPHKKGWQDSLMLGYVALSYVEKNYVVDADVQDVRLSPLFEKDLAKLPPAFVLTCDLDPLRIEGRAYADMLVAAGNEVDYRHLKNVPHGFLNFTKAFPIGKSTAVDVGAFLRQKVGKI